MAGSKLEFDDGCMVEPIANLMEDIVFKVERAVKTLFSSDKLERSAQKVIRIRRS